MVSGGRWRPNWAIGQFGILRVAWGVQAAGVYPGAFREGGRARVLVWFPDCEGLWGADAVRRTPALPSSFSLLTASGAVGGVDGAGAGGFGSRTGWIRPRGLNDGLGLRACRWWRSSVLRYRDLERESRRPAFRIRPLGRACRGEGGAGFHLAVPGRLSVLPATSPSRARPPSASWRQVRPKAGSSAAAASSGLGIIWRGGQSRIALIVAGGLPLSTRVPGGSAPASRFAAAMSVFRYTPSPGFAIRFMATQYTL